MPRQREKYSPCFWKYPATGLKNDAIGCQKKRPKNPLLGDRTQVRAGLSLDGAALVPLRNGNYLDFGNTPQYLSNLHPDDRRALIHGLESQH